MRHQDVPRVLIRLNVQGMMRHNMIQNSPSKDAMHVILLRMVVTLASSIITSYAMLMPSSRLLQVATISTNSCSIHQRKSINVSASNTSLHVWLMPWSASMWRLSTHKGSWMFSTIFIHSLMKQAYILCCCFNEWTLLYSYNIFANLFPIFTIFRGRAQIHNGTEKFPAKWATAWERGSKCYCLRSTLWQKSTHVNAIFLGAI